MKKKVILLVAAAMLVSMAAFSQDAKEAAKTDTTKVQKKWTRSGTAALTMSQSSFTNWSSGGDNAVAGAATLGYKALYKHGKHVWENTFDAAYGLTFQSSEKRKNEDRFEINSKYGYQVHKSWYLSSLVTLKSQFDKGYNSYPRNGQDYNSKFFAPGYLTVMPIGVEYRPNDAFSVVFSPVTAKFTFVFDDMLSDKGAFGVKPGKKTLSEFGAYLKAQYTKTFFKTLAFKTKLELFSSYTNHPQNIDVNWEVDIAYKVTKWLAFTFYSQLLYDDDTKTFDDAGVQTHGPRVQFKQVGGVGLSFILP